MKKAKQEAKLSEIIESISIQEQLLEQGSRHLKKLNDEYETLYREYQALVFQKNKLITEIETLSKNIDIYSNFS